MPRRTQAARPASRQASRSAPRLTSRLTSRLTAITAALAAVALLGGCADEVSSHSSDGGGGGGGTKVKIMVGGIDKVIYLPAMLAQRLGYFKDEGLNVELLSEPAGIDATTSLVAGNVQGVVGFYDHTLDLQTKGKEVESVVQLAQTPGEVEIASTEAAGDLASPKDFAGKKLGVTGLGSSTDFLTKYLGVHAGVSTDTFTNVAVGAGQTFISALQKGSIDGGMTTDPTVAQILDKKIGKVVVDMRTPEGSRQALGGLYPSSSLYMNTSWANAHEDTVQKLADAFVRTLKWMSRHSAEDIAAKMPSDYAQGGKGLYVQAITNTLPMFTEDGRMPDGGPDTVQRVLAAFNPNLKDTTVDLDKTYTTKFTDKAK